MQKLDRDLSCTLRWSTRKGYTEITQMFLDDYKELAINLYGAKLYLMDDGRWLIMDYLNIPDAPRHYIDCIEGDICNMNVRIISESTKREIEKNQEIFQEEFE